jgi:hypothetical protein
VDLSIKYITDLWISVIFLHFRFIDSFLNLLDKVTTVRGSHGQLQLHRFFSESSGQDHNRQR